MKIHSPLSILLSLTLLAAGGTVFGQYLIPPGGHAFNYQGVLLQNGSPASGLYEIQASLLDTNGVAWGPTLTNQIAASAGVFTVGLDFGASLLADPMPIPPGLLLGLGIRPQGSQGDFTPLDPPQPLRPVPFAMNAIRALNVASNVVDSAAIRPGAITASKLAEGAISSGHILGGQVVKSLNGLTDHLSLLGGNDVTITPSTNGLILGVVKNCNDYTNCYWSLRGNGNTVDGVNFLGTINSVPLSLRVNNQRVMRYEHTGVSPNLIGGYALNAVSGAFGATIGGGGAAGAENSIAGNFGTIGGGLDHAIGLGALYATIGGGTNNQVSDAALGAAIAGGADNRIASLSLWGTIAGGRLNLVSTSAPIATISGGFGNRIQPGVSTATIGGGSANVVDADLGTIAGGSSNRIEIIAHRATIGGGYNSRIQSNAIASVIGGGVANLIEPSSQQATVSGGQSNRIQFMASAATIAGGDANRIGTNATGAVVGGGMRQDVDAPFAVIDGGTDNRIDGGATNGVIGGGAGNSIGTSAVNATIAGGNANVVWFGAGNAAIGGGRGNAVNPNAAASTIAGGFFNAIRPSAAVATIGGGQNNIIDTNATASTIGGGWANRIFPNVIAATIPGGRDAAGTNYGQFAYASGQFDEPGDAQTSLYVLRNTTTSAAITNELFLDGAGQRIRIRPGSTVSFDIQVSARGSAGDLGAAYRLNGAIERSLAGLTTFIGTVDSLPGFPKEELATWDVQVSADDVNDALVIRGVGDANNTVRWVATVRTSEVKW